jgi:hypothetical protein
VLPVPAGRLTVEQRLSVAREHDPHGDIDAVIFHSIRNVGRRPRLVQDILLGGDK